ncbi:MAG: helix-turn-helix domain-containing protein [Roseburia sp.]|nr:helix-turn-helix domain-containing protein [Roseburia sp.]
MNETDSFGKRLRAMRQERNLGQIKLAKELDVGKSIISLWENDECEPTLSKLVAIAKYFDVSIDYLAGLEN